MLAPLLVPLLLWAVHTAAAADLPSASLPETTAARHESGPVSPDESRLSVLGAGDQISIQFFGQPDMDGTIYVGDDGTVRVPLAGAVQVAGLSPPEAAQRIEQAMVRGQYLVNPHVTITILQYNSQRVSVLGEVRTPGRYPISPNTSVFDLLAQAGGVTDNASGFVEIQRLGANGQRTRYRLDRVAAGSQSLEGGDSIFVPTADQFYIYGEVTNPNKYRIEPGMTVIQAVARAGGVTPRGSERRIDIKRIAKDGKYQITHAAPDELIEPDDVIHVKESIF